MLACTRLRAHMRIAYYTLNRLAAHALTLFFGFGCHSMGAIVKVLLYLAPLWFACGQQELQGAN